MKKSIFDHTEPKTLRYENPENANSLKKYYFYFNPVRCLSDD
jgi:hypothetical protein